MKLTKILPVLLLPLVLQACNGSDNDDVQALSLELQSLAASESVSLVAYEPCDYADSEMASFSPSSNSVQFAQDVAYDSFEETAFDIFLPEADEPTPLIIYIHGGGFTCGDKSAVYARMQDHVQSTLDSGVAYATLNYRLLDDVDSDGVHKALKDSRRGLQFIRYYAEELNIDPGQIAIYGASAGAGTALWLAFHDDMAGEGNGDVIDQQSTRIRAVGAIETQATYDLVRWEQDVLEPVGVTLGIAVQLGMEQRLLSFYGLTPQTDEEVAAAVDAVYNDPDVAVYRADVDMLALMTADDVPMWVNNYRITYTPSGSLIDWIFHHPLHAEALHERAQFVGLESVAYYPLNLTPFEDPSGEDVIPFLIRHIDF